MRRKQASKNKVNKGKKERRKKRSLSTLRLPNKDILRQLYTFHRFTWALGHVLLLAIPKVVGNFLLPLLYAPSSSSCFPPVLLFIVRGGAGVIGAAAAGEVSQVVGALASWCLTAFWHGGQGLTRTNTDTDTYTVFIRRTNTIIKCTYKYNRHICMDKIYEHIWPFFSAFILMGPTLTALAS